jgi:hypothetical protein
MAVGFQSSTTANGNYSGGSGNLTVGVPSGLTTNDCWLIISTADIDTGTGDISLASGFSAATANVAYSYPKSRAQYKVAGASESSASVPHASSSYQVYATSMRFDGTHTSTPVGNASTDNGAGGSVTVTPPAVTIANDSSMAVTLCAAYTSTSTPTWSAPPSSMTEVNAVEVIYAPHIVAYKAVDTGSFSPGAFTNTQAMYQYVAFNIELVPAAAAATITQAAFAFGDDDGTESGHTLDTENTNYTGAANTAKTLRFQLNTSGDPAAKTFRLKYQKDGSGGYSTIGVGASSPTPGNVAFGAASESHTGTTGATSSYNWTHTAAAGPEGVVVCVYNRATGVYPASDVTYGGVSLARITGGQAQDTTTGTEGGTVDVWFIGTGLSGVGANPNVAVTLGEAGVACYAVCFTVTADGDCSYAGVISEQDNQTLTEENVDDGNASGASLRVAFVLSGASTVPSAGSNSTAGPGIDFGAYVNGSYYETTPGYGSRPVGASYGTSDDVAAIYMAITASVNQDNDVYVDSSANISASGADSTTNRLSTTGGTFQAGARIDDSATAPSLDFTSGYQSEWEWRINTKSGLSNGTYFEFRLYDSDTVLDTYTYTPKWTIGGASSFQAAWARNANSIIKV